MQPASGSEPPASLALDDIMLIEDDEEGNPNNSSDIAKIADIQDQLQKQAEIIRDLLVQRDFLINQILQERDRWQSERDGWDRTSEALVARHARRDRDGDSGKEEELTHLCAVYESDNKALKEKLHDTHARLADLEAELSKLKPLLVMQPHLVSRPYRQDPTRRPMPYPYAQMQSYNAPVPTASTHHAPLSPYKDTITPVSTNRGKKRRRDDHVVDPSSHKGKEKGAPSNTAGSDSNGDGDTDTEAPPTPTPASSSWNPYAYMNDFYRHPSSPPKLSPLKPPNVHSSPPINAYAVSYPYSYIVPFSKQPSASNPGASVSTRPDNADKDGSQGESNTESQKDKPQPSSTKTTARRIAGTTSRNQHQGKNKTSTLLSDARAEHLLLAARKIGRERAAAIAGIVKMQDKPVVVPEEASSHKAKAKEQASGTPSGSTVKRTAPLKSRPTLIQSPTTPTPTPRRILAPGDKMLHSSPLTHLSSIGATSTARSRDTLVSSTRSVTRTLSTISSGANAGSNEDMTSGSGQTPLDSLVSAARTMLSEDCDTPTHATHGHRITVSDSAIGASGDTSRHQPQSQVEKRGVEESVQKKKRRRNTATANATRSPATPRPRTVTEKQRGNALIPNTDLDREFISTLAAKRVPAHSSALANQRTRSALDVLADQAAAASSDGGASGIGSSTHIEGSLSEVGNQGAVFGRHDTESTPPLTAPYPAPHLIDEASLAFLRDHRVPSGQQTTQSGTANSVPKRGAASHSDGAGVTMEHALEVNSSDAPLPVMPNEGDILDPSALEWLHSGADGLLASNTNISNTSAPTKTAPSLRKGPGDPVRSESHSTNYPDRNRILLDHGSARKNRPEIRDSDPFGSRPNLGGDIIVVINEPGAECTSVSSEGEGGDLDAEGDIDPDSQDVLSLTLDI